MDDPTRRCENDTGNETRLPGLPVPSGSPTFLPALLCLGLRLLHVLSPYFRICSS
jgi:hypothetical protein